MQCFDAMVSTPRWVKAIIACAIIFVIFAAPVYFLTSLVISNEESAVEVRGSGSSLPSSVIDAWNAEYSSATARYGTYAVSSSDDGVDSLFAQSAPSFYAATDMSMSSDQLSSRGVQQLPSVATGVVFLYNIPTSWLPASTSLNITMEIMCGIFNGTIFEWSNELIMAANPALPKKELPRNLINPAHYTASNGATYMLTTTLSQYSANFRSAYGSGDTLNWPVTPGGKETTINADSDMPAYIAQNAWSCGYATLPVTLLYNSSSIGMSNFVSRCDTPPCNVVLKPSAELIAETAALATFDQETLAASYGNISLYDCRNCWPMTNYSYMVVRRDYNFTDCDKKVRNLLRWLEWCYEDSAANVIANNAGFAFNQSAEYAQISSMGDKITCFGKSIASPQDTTMWPWVALALWFLLMCIVAFFLVLYSILRQKRKLKLAEDEEKRRLLDPKVKLSPLLMKASIGEEELRLDKPIGTGSFGEVYSGYWRGTKVAIKRMLINNTRVAEDGSTLEDFIREANLMSTLRHPNIIQFLGATLTDEYIYIVLELAERGSLYDVLKDKKVELGLNKKLKIAEDAARGMLYLHSCTPPVIHRDLKTANLLVSHGWEIKVTDFGLSRVLDTQNTMTHCGTVDFAAPEVLQRNRYTQKADVYSFGLVLWQIFTRKEPYYGLPIYEMMNKIINEGHRPDISLVEQEELAQLIEECWAQDPDARPDMPEVLERLLDVRRRVGLSRTLNMSHSPTRLESDADGGDEDEDGGGGEGTRQGRGEGAGGDAVEVVVDGHVQVSRSPVSLKHLGTSLPEKDSIV